VGGQSFPAWGNSYNQKAKTKGTQPTPPQHKIMWWEAPKPLQIVWFFACHPDGPAVL